MLQEVVELYEDVAEARKVRVTLEPGEEVTVSGARDRLRQVFANLLDNAIKYTPESGHVGIAVTRDGDSAVVTVADNGVGIPAQHLPRIWDRLYRADPSRSERPGTRPEPGQGLRPPTAARSSQSEPATVRPSRFVCLSANREVLTVDR